MSPLCDCDWCSGRFDPDGEWEDPWLTEPPDEKLLAAFKEAEKRIPTLSVAIQKAALEAFGHEIRVARQTLAERLMVAHEAVQKAPVDCPVCRGKLVERAGALVCARCAE